MTTIGAEGISPRDTHTKAYLIYFHENERKCHLPGKMFRINIMKFIGMSNNNSKIKRISNLNMFQMKMNNGVIEKVGIAKDLRSILR